jgi:hypothetical protein
MKHSERLDRRVGIISSGTLGNSLKNRESTVSNCTFALELRDWRFDFINRVRRVVEVHSHDERGPH